MKQDVRELAERSARECKPGGTWWRGICQPCLVRTGKPDRRGCFSFNPTNGFYKCFKCGLRGRIDGDYHDAVDRLQGELKDIKWKAPEGYYELYEEPGMTAMSLAGARRYLVNRGLGSRSLLRRFRVGACNDGYWNNRIVVPLLTPDEEWAGWVGRVWLEPSSASPKYLYPKGMTRDLLFNHAALLRDTKEPVYVVEGVLDVLGIGRPQAQTGDGPILEGVATLGQISQEQFYALVESPRSVILASDGDAWRDSEALAMQLRLEGQRAGWVQLPPGKDPDEMDRGWLHEEGQASLE